MSTHFLLAFNIYKIQEGMLKTKFEARRNLIAKKSTTVGMNIIEQGKTICLNLLVVEGTQLGRVFVDLKVGSVLLVLSYNKCPQLGIACVHTAH